MILTLRGPHTPDASTRAAIDWFAADGEWGGHVVVAANGSHVADRHVEIDDEDGAA